VIEYKMAAQLVRITGYSCPKRVFHVNRQDGWTQCRFPEGEEKQCNGHVGREFRVYANRLPSDSGEVS